MRSAAFVHSIKVALRRDTTIAGSLCGFRTCFVQGRPLGPFMQRLLVAYIWRWNYRKSGWWPLREQCCCTWYSPQVRAAARVRHRTPCTNDRFSKADFQSSTTSQRQDRQRRQEQPALEPPMSSRAFRTRRQTLFHVGIRHALRCENIVVFFYS